MSMPSDWEGPKVETSWIKRGEDFHIQVVNWVRRPPNRWNVYAYIYAAHPLFCKLNRRDAAIQPRLSELPLHGGPSLWKWHTTDSAELATFQIGSDYMRDGDERFEDIGPDGGIPPQILRDAEELYQYLAIGYKSQEEVPA